MSKYETHKGTVPIIPAWSNCNNAAFYEETPANVFMEFAARGGIDSCCDLELIKPYLDQAKSILEVGAGYGRVIDYLINNNFAAKITALERSKQFFNLLTQKYQNKVNLIQVDLPNYQTTDRYDLILWMWSGISDFAQEEQLPILSLLTKLLTKNGILVIDTLVHSKKLKNESYSAGKNYVIEVNECKIYGYKPSPEEIDAYAAALNFKQVKHLLEYETNMKLKRNLHILSR